MMQLTAKREGKKKPPILTWWDGKAPLRRGHLQFSVFGIQFWGGKRWFNTFTNNLSLPRQLCLPEAVERHRAKMKKNNLNPGGAKAQRDAIYALWKFVSYGKPCDRCGAQVKLAHMHHIDPSTKRFEVKASTATRAKFHEERAKCARLCPACHRQTHRVMWAIEQVRLGRMSEQKAALVVERMNCRSNRGSLTLA
ncbi:MAG: hypothetical protein MN733_21020 [Nitrososphaera sp.]|nr:hypothetical protein [Nitrososphaera sp.]